MQTAEDDRPAASLTSAAVAIGPPPVQLAEARRPLRRGPYVYALGRIEPRFPASRWKRNLPRSTGRAADTKGLTDREAMQSYHVTARRTATWRGKCAGSDHPGAGDLHPPAARDSADFDLLVEAIRPTPSPTDLDVVIGLRGPIAPPEMCNGLMIPTVVFDQIYSFDRDTLIKSIPTPEERDARRNFTPAAEELFDRIMQMADNAGATDEHRALNYCAVRYPAIYARRPSLREECVIERGGCSPIAAQWRPQGIWM